VVGNAADIERRRSLMRIPQVAQNVLVGGFAAPHEGQGTETAKQISLRNRILLGSIQASGGNPVESLGTS